MNRREVPPIDDWPNRRRDVSGGVRTVSRAANAGTGSAALSVEQRLGGNPDSVGR
jgi:hypothetical protein